MLWTYLNSLPRESLLYVVVLAVALAPWVSRWQRRVGRWLTRARWVSLGVVLGLALAQIINTV